MAAPGNISGMHRHRSAGVFLIMDCGAFAAAFSLTAKFPLLYSISIPKPPSCTRFVLRLNRRILMTNHKGGFHDTEDSGLD